MQCCLCLIRSLKYFVTCHIPPQKENHMHRDSTYNILFTVCLSMLFKSDRVFWHDLGCFRSPHHLRMLISLLPGRCYLLLTPQSRGCQACHIHLMYGWERESENCKAIWFKQTFTLTRHKKGLCSWKGLTKPIVLWDNKGDQVWRCEALQRHAMKLIILEM